MLDRIQIRPNFATFTATKYSQISLV